VTAVVGGGWCTTVEVCHVESCGHGQRVRDGHVVLHLECLERVHLNGNVPNLQGPSVPRGDVERATPFALVTPSARV